MVHSVITQTKCQCGEPAVGKFLMKRASELVVFDVDEYYWLNACDEHLEKAKQQGLLTKYNP